MKQKQKERWKVTVARSRRAHRLSQAVLEWQRLAAQRRFPRSLVDILQAALVREYALGRRAESSR